MVELYCGDGKGKTTAAAGLSLRAAGHGIPVVFAQFLKNSTSGEIKALSCFNEVTIMHPSCFYGFVKSMTPEQKYETRIANNTMLISVRKLIANYKRCVVVLDEIVHAVNYDLVDIDILKKLISESNADIEIVLTGRFPSKELIDMADYYTEFRKIKHVYDKGVSAREGIEY